jgi:CHAT domain-containing protein
VYTIVVEKRVRTILVTSQVQRSYESPVDAGAMGQMVLAYREALRDRRDTRPVAKALYDVLVSPMIKDLSAARTKTIMWWLDGALRYVPVAALYDGERWLVERYRTAVFTLGSLSRLELKPRRTWRALGLGVTLAHDVPGPDPGSPAMRLAALPGVQAELKAIVRESTAERGLLPGLRRLDAAFTREVLRSKTGGRYSLVHVASHFVFRPGDEARSFLLLGDGSQLSLGELQRFAQLENVDLFTLSACETAVGGSEDGREVDALAIIAQRKGAAAVLATLWPVADASTSAFMSEFYRRRERGKTSKAEALRETQLAFLRGEVTPAPESAGRGTRIRSHSGEPTTNWTHPYYWAPFVLIGNWR